MRVFLDANILFSAAYPRSRMGTFLLVLFRHARCLANAYVAEEARRNLEAKCPAGLPNLVAILKKCEFVHTLTVELGVNLHAKDVPVLGGAIAGRATHLLTGDEQDFGSLFGKTISGVKVVSPRMLADELVRQRFLDKKN